MVGLVLGIGIEIEFWLCLGFVLFSYFAVLHLFFLEIIITAFLSSTPIIKKKKNTLVPIATSKINSSSRPEEFPENCL